MSLKSIFLHAAALALLSASLPAAVIGINPPSLPITAERIATLPAVEQPAWRDYLARSAAARAADTGFYADELKAHNLTAPLVPGHGPSPTLTEPAAWYATAGARRIADIIVSFQTPAGGWNKNSDFTGHARRPGERSGYEAGYVGTIDNGATVEPLRFLALVITAGDAASTAPYRTAFLRGIDYLLAAQFPNGGWPQVYPLEGGYHDAITYNDGAMINVLTLFREVSTQQPGFAFVPADTRARATAAGQRGLACILATQIVVAGRRTVWCQQHDALTLAPTSARNYEMPAQSSGESAGLMFFLISLPIPSAEIATAIHAAAAWLEKTALKDVIFKPTPDGTGRHLIPTPGATPLWPRYAEIGTDRPLFGDRDKTIHDHIDEISKERRNGYAWFGDAPKRVLAHYAKWARTHPAR
ncbi:MAG: pectate lyase [Undibacterium sp.]|nr:pectate lyase [Opitutaceae bacterium]